MLPPSWKSFGIPLVASSEIRNGLEIRDLYLKVLRPFSVPTSSSKDSHVDSVTAATETAEMTDATCPDLSEVAGQKELESQYGTDLQLYWTDEKGKVGISEIALDEPVSSTTGADWLYVIVCWPDKMAKQYDKRLLSSLPEVFKSGLFAKRPQESVSLYKCLEAFIKEEPLGPEDMWFCPGCKIHCQASKKLDLWRLPEILVIHLKRFSYNRYLKNKLETYIDFPVHDLDLSTYIAGKSEQSCNRYMLYAISNHYGSMGGGHYTAFVRHDGNRWYDFDDSHVSPISEDRIKTSAAYVLFYRRVEDE